MTSTYNVQKITACAFLHKDGKLFVARRADTKKFLPGIYELPGGHIEFGETMEEGLAREMKEEFGIEVVVGDPFYTFTYTNQENSKHTIEVVYFSQLKNPNQEIKLNPDDHSEYMWLTKKEVKEIFLKQNENEGKAAIKGFEILSRK